MRIDRFLDTPFVDEHRLNLHFKFYRMRNIPLSHVKPDNDDETVFGDPIIYYAHQLISLIKDEDPIYIPLNFFNTIQDHLQEIEGSILTILYHEFNNGNGDANFEDIDNVKKVQRIIDRIKDPEDKRCFVDYQQNKDIIKLIESFYHFQYSKELELLEEYVPQGELC